MKWLLFLLTILLCGCAGVRGANGIKCAKKPKKIKTYRVKKMKPIDRPYYAASGGSSKTERAEEPEPMPDNEMAIAPEANEDNESDKLASKEPEQSTDGIEIQRENEPIEIEKQRSSKIEQVEVLPLSTKEEPITSTLNDQKLSVSVPKIEKQVPKQPIKEPLEMSALDSKTNTITAQGKEKPEIILSFREKVINVSEGYSFNELIPFVINRDELLHPDEAYEKIEDLSALLKEHPEVQVTIIANTATDEPHPAHRYGGDEETLSNGWEKKQDSLQNGKLFSLKDLMIARSKRIKTLLIENGVNEAQLDYQLGTHNMWKYQRYVTFVLKEEE